MLRKNKLNNRGQITIFIILALIMVIGIALLFVLIKKPFLQVEDVENPQAYIESCTKEAVEEVLDILMPQGGDINPKGYIVFENIERTYLCYNEDYYIPCINQRPMLIEHIENEITDYINPKVNNCFNALKAKLEEKNYIIDMGEMQLTTKLQTKQVLVNINKDFKMTKNEKTRDFKNFKMNLIHPVYELAEIAMEVANQEAKYCYFDILGYMIFYPDYNLNKFRPSDYNIIYKIKERASNQEFVFAIRSCAIPPGF